MRKQFLILLSGLLLGAMGLQSCNERNEAREGYHTVHSKIEKLEQDSAVDYGVSRLDHLECLRTIKTDSNYTEEVFLIPERSSQIEGYKCSVCHTKTLPELKASTKGNKKSHWDKTLNHASADIMNCTTCHTADNMDVLHSLTGDTILFDHSYKMCGQCHSGEFKDWQNGAHGKQLGGWAPPRVSKTCVNCHNPHDPAFKSKMPARLNTKMMKEQRKSDPDHHEEH